MDIKILLTVFVLIATGIIFTFKKVKSFSYKSTYQKHFKVDKNDMPPRRTDFTLIQLYDLIHGKLKICNTHELIEKYINAKAMLNSLSRANSILLSLITSAVVSAIFLLLTDFTLKNTGLGLLILATTTVVAIWSVMQIVLIDFYEVKVMVIEHILEKSK